MPLPDWIKSQIEALRAMMSPDDDAAEVRETKTSDKLELQFKSDPANVARVRKSIEQFSKEAGLEQSACEEIGLVVNEALANVIRHAYCGDHDRPIEVSALANDEGVTIHIRDWGNGEDPSKRPVREHDPLTPGGLGLVCLRQLMDNVQYICQPDGMLLTMTRNKTRAQP